MFDLTKLHTFGLAASAESYSHFKSFRELSDNLNVFQTGRYLLLGQGSNCIFVDDFEGRIVRLDSEGIQVEEDERGYRLTVQAGENWHKLVVFCMKKGIFGFENLALIPGTVGAAPIQNIGAYGVELAQFVEYIHCLNLTNGRSIKLAQQDCQFGYRDSVFKKNPSNSLVIHSVVFYVPKNWQAVAHYGELLKLKQPSAQDIFDKVVQIRRQKLPDPDEIGNAGSFFKNPLVSRNHLASLRCDWVDIPYYDVDQTSVKVPAAWLIDKLGFKGKKEGGIGCHPHQALVLTNDGMGTGEQLLVLVRDIQEKVNQEFAISLENEVRLIGKKGPISL